MTPTEIRTERLRLVPVEPAAARQIVAGDLSAVTPGAGWPHKDTLDGLRLAIEAGSSPGWLVTLLDGTVIGECGCKGGVSADDAAEIGYRLAAPYRGQGYGREAVAALVDWLLGPGGLRTVVAETVADNAASRRVLERSGFTVTSTDGAAVHYTRDALAASRPAARTDRG